MSAKDNNTNTNIYRSYIDALLYPEQNPFIEDMKRFEELMMMYSCAIKEVQTKLDVLNTDFSVRYNRNPIEFIQSRIKKPVSIATKLSSKGCQVSVENIVYNLNDDHQLRYKKDVADPELISGRLKHCADVISQTDLEMQEIKNMIYGDGAQPQIKLCLEKNTENF